MAEGKPKYNPEAKARYNFESQRRKVFDEIFKVHASLLGVPRFPTEFLLLDRNIKTVIGALDLAIEDGLAIKDAEGRYTIKGNPPGAGKLFK